MASLSTRSASVNSEGLMLVLAFSLLLAGCATSETRETGPAANVAGTWNGSYVSIGAPFSFVAVFEQQGNAVTGTISGGRPAYNGPVQGRVSGSHFAWKQVNGTGSGDVIVKGDEMTGRGTSTPYDGTVTLRRASR